MPLSKFITTATITLQSIENVAIYQSEIISSNGNLFKPYDTKTNLTFCIYQDFKNITDQFNDIEWKSYSFDSNNVIEDKNWGSQHTGKKYIEVNKDTINGKCLIQADAYTVIKGVRTCVASARITLIDVNELYNGDVPPENPIGGTLWVDTSSSPLIIYSWNDFLNKWEAVGTTTPFVRNLILNSNFWKLNNTNFIIENDECLLDTRVVNSFDKNWLRIMSSSSTQESTTAGISQTTTYPILKNSDYTLSFLAYRVNNVEYKGQSIYIKILSIEANGASTELLTTLKLINENDTTQVSVSFKSLNNTTQIRVIIGVEPNKMCEFYVTELSLYNTNAFYPWELAPEDVYEQLSNKLDDDHEAVFNALTKNKTMEGIYITTDDNGDQHFYFNATHIKTGSLDGGLINGVGLHIRDDSTGESIFHVYKDEQGTHIDMTANNLYIGPTKETATTKDYVDTNISNTKDYADNEIAANRSDSERILNDNIATAKSEAISSSNSYTDNKVSESITKNEGYTNDQVGTTQTYLVEYINEKANKAEENSNNYTDDKIKDMNNSNNENNINLREEIKSAKESAIADANKYTDNEIKNTKSDITDYVDNKTKAITDTVNNKADSSIVNPLVELVDIIDKRTTATMITSTVTSSDTYINDLSKKVNNTDFNNYKKEIDDKFEFIDFTPDFSTIETLDLLTVYTNQGITKSGNSSTDDDLEVDTIVDNISFVKRGTNITMNVAKISDTNYVKTSGSNTYIDNNEMIKLLLYEIQLLKKEINELKNNNE